eukprot:TRINITY_DN113003_c0_g1_i1.p1 TRINITY_DN113003_c0_g1~~TRINITY_DN113003_c0_g1_i1.p1  ORF type:complete len:291 (-),score=71.84 TRINITY_DN113003_c0_g1_i1:81-953(-)
MALLHMGRLLLHVAALCVCGAFALSLAGSGLGAAVDTKPGQRALHRDAAHEVIRLGPGFGLLVCRRGDGKSFPKAGDVVKLNYKGLRRDGSVFASTEQHGKAMAFEVGSSEVFKGLDAGLMKMSLGERAILQVPAAMACGAVTRAGGAEGAAGGADVRFELQLLAINDTKGEPEQGFEGDDVAHEDWQTCTEDWGVEYGTEWEEGSDKGPCSPDDDEDDARRDSRSRSKKEAGGDERTSKKEPAAEKSSTTTTSSSPTSSKSQSPASAPPPAMLTRVCALAALVCSLLIV